MSTSSEAVHSPSYRRDSERFRHELKFIVPVGAAETLYRELEVYCDYDKHAGVTKSYEVASVYYDTEDLQFYWDREESVGYRRKIRLRSYNSEGESKALFVEIKEKHKQFVCKKRANLTSNEILTKTSLHDRIPLSEVLSYLDDTAEGREISYLHKRLELKPIVMIRYQRKAILPRFENDMRITLDTELWGGGTSLAQRDDSQERSLIAPGSGIFEVKTNFNVPLWLQSILLRYELRQTKFSKYCVAVRAINRFSLTRNHVGADAA